MFDDVITKGIHYLGESQQVDGSFLSNSATSITFNKSIERSSPFFTSLVLSSLNSLPFSQKQLTIKGASASFLLTQNSKNWSFNYWARNSTESKQIPYPDDLDDTFCAATALYVHNPKIISGKVLAKLIQLLTFLEKKEGGPYKTWLVSEDADEVWKDVDIAVNSNIGYFLSLIDVDLPNISKLIEEKLKQKKLTSPYYYTQIPVIYFISRSYKGKYKKDFIKHVLSLRNSKNSWGNPLLNSLAVLALLNFGSYESVDESLIAKIAASQKTDGSFGIYPLVIEKVSAEKTIYAGSEALTTALCLEAIYKYQHALTSVKKIDKRAEQYRHKVINSVEQKYAHAGRQVNLQSKKIIEYILLMDEKNNITMLPFLFAQAVGKKSKKISEGYLIRLGVINLLGWISYTVYDDFLDGDGKPEALSIGNIALRQLVVEADRIALKHTGFDIIFEQLMNLVDEANTWEAINCRSIQSIPNYKSFEVIGNKSIAIAITPIAILFALGYKIQSVEVNNLLYFFTDYLVARQLNDDAHDWEEDLKRGHISPVVAMLKKRASKTPGKALQDIFWSDVILDICHEIDRRVARAKNRINKMPFIENQKVLLDLLIPIEQASHKAQEGRKKTISFIAAYED